MSNHHHVILHTRPDRLKHLPDKEIARRWLRALPRRIDEQGLPLTPSEAEVWAISQTPGKIGRLRRRLARVSWFMAFLNEYIARRANAEDDVTGRFFEGRFSARALLDEAAVLACMAYVDLNPVRAKVADSPECSAFTGAYDRIMARQAKAKIKALAEARRSGSAKAPARGRLNATQKKEIRKARKNRLRDRWLCELDSRRGPRSGLAEGRKSGLFPISVDEYLQLLDWTGRQLKAGKRGSIPNHLAPILQRLALEVNAWLRMVEGMGDLFWRVVGRVETMARAARKAGRRWFRGLAASRMAFGEG